MSFVNDKISHRAFRQVVNMGELVIPLIIAELRRRSDFLFLALDEIVPEEVASISAVGNASARVDAWIRWYDRTGGHAD